MKRKATAYWQGTGKEGKGQLTTQSKTLDKTQYNYTSRFEQGIGTNPEELVAAAHAGCFTMKLSFGLNGAGFTAESLETTCVVTLEDGVITTSHLTLSAKVPGISQEKFDELVKDSELNCPISRTLTSKISSEAGLLQENDFPHPSLNARIFAARSCLICETTFSEATGPCHELTGFHRQVTEERKKFLPGQVNFNGAIFVYDENQELYQI